MTKLFCHNDCKPTGCRRVDSCIKEMCDHLAAMGYVISASCCGHGKHPATIVIRQGVKNVVYREFFSDKVIPRKRNYYVRCTDGTYMIPEIG